MLMALVAAPAAQAAAAPARTLAPTHNQMAAHGHGICQRNRTLPDPADGPVPGRLVAAVRADGGQP